MSLHYILDGYNLIWSTEIFGSGRLQDQRERFLRFLEDRRPGGSERNLVTVVFDGQDNVDGPLWKGTVKVVFSRGGDADEEIKRLIDNAPNPRDVVVVSNDRNIQRWARVGHAKTLSCADFLNK